MSNQLYLRGRCEVLLGKGDLDLINAEEFRKDYAFGIAKGGQGVNMKLLKDGKTIEAEMVVNDFEPNILQILRVDEYEKLDDKQERELHKTTSPIVESMRQLVGLLKQEHSRFDISDELIGNLGIEWSLGNNEWHPTPRGLVMYLTTYGLGNVNDSTAINLQELLSENEQALLATSYLHQAMKARSSRYQWIYATIAAELAIKEILVRIEPKLEVILRTLPSPPLNKLYGDVLESVAGVKSEGLKRLQEGAERRNRLLHSLGDDAPLSVDEAHEYVHFISQRIDWLLDQWRKIKRARGQSEAEA